MSDTGADPATPEALRALRKAVSGSESGFEHHTDRSLSRFLRAKKTVDRATKLLSAYESYRTEKGIQHGQFPYEKIAERHALGILQIDPVNCFGKGGAIIVHGRPALNDGKDKDAIALLFFYMFDWLTINVERAQTNGIMLIVDWTGMTFGKLDSSLPAKILPLLQSVLPVRVKMIAHVNQPGFFSMVFAIIKPLLGGKLRSRLKVLGGQEHLLKYVEKEHLPKLLGGDIDVSLDSNRLGAKAGGEDLSAYLSTQEPHFGRP